MNIPELKKDIKQHLSKRVFHCDRQVYLKNLAKLYKSSAEMLNQHAPLETKTVTLRKPTPFVNADKLQKEKQSKNGKKLDLKKT